MKTIPTFKFEEITLKKMACTSPCRAGKSKCHFWDSCESDYAQFNKFFGLYPEHLCSEVKAKHCFIKTETI